MGWHTARFSREAMKWLVRGVVSMALVGVGCLPDCPRGEVRVKGARGGTECVVDDLPAAQVAPSDAGLGPDDRYESMTIPQAPSEGGAPAPAGCRSEHAGDLDVSVVAKSGVPNVPVGTAPPDGRYVLAQATWFARDAGAPTLTAMRAELVVQGAVYVLGARAVDGSALGPAESVTATLVAGTATHVCSLATARVVASLFPTAGASTPAFAAWDGAVSTLTVVVTTPAGADVELVFVPW